MEMMSLKKDQNIQKLTDRIGTVEDELARYLEIIDFLQNFFLPCTTSPFNLGLLNALPPRLHVRFFSDATHLKISCSEKRGCYTKMLRQKFCDN